MGSARFTSWLAALGLILGMHHGYIALWRDGETVPEQVFPYRAAMLPEADSRRLEAGIRIENEGMLHSLLEDYLS